MKPARPLLVTALWVAVACSVMVGRAATLTTPQNCALAVPATSIAATGLPGATNLAGSNFLLSAVMPATLHGGGAALVNSQQWVSRYNAGLGSSQNAGYAIAFRGDGSIVVAGPSQGLTSRDDFVTLAYAPNGTPLWTNRYDGPGHGDDTARFVATTATGEVLVAGDSQRYGTNSLLTDVMVLKYASDGTPVWTNRYSSFETNGAWSSGLVVDGSGNAFVRLSSSNWLPLGWGIPVEDALIKFDPQGNVAWTKHYLSAAPDSGQDVHDIEALTLDNSGNLLLAGISGSGSYDTGSSIVKYNSDGTGMWTNHHPFGFMLVIRSLLVDRRGDIILTGEGWSTNQENYLVMKCSKDGVSLWTNALAGPTYDGGNVPRTALDAAGNVFVIGGRSGVAETGLYQLLKLSSDGVPLWTNLNADVGATNSGIYGSAVDSAANLYLLSNAPTPGNPYPGWVTVKYSSDGRPVWTNRFDAPAGLSESSFALAVDGAGEVSVTGESQRSSGNWDLTTVKYADRLFYTPPADFTGSDALTYTLTDTFGNSATGSVAVLVTPGSFRFNLSPAATRMTPGGLHSELDGASGTSAVVIEASTDLMHWQPILTNPPVNGSLQFLDAGALGQAHRYYRALQPQ